MIWILLVFWPALAPAGTTPFIPVEPTQVQALGIRTVPVEPANRAWGDAWPATVRVPNAQLRVVSAPQEGLIASLPVAEGEAVHAGQVLAVIQSPALVEAQRLYLEARSRLSLAAGQLRRDRQLQREGIIAQRRYLETRARHAQATTEVEQRRQALLLAGMDEAAIRALERRRRLSAELRIRAPIDGVVLAQLATPGQRVEMATPLYRIGRLDPLWLEVQVPLERLSGVRPGTPVRVEGGGPEGRVVTLGSRIQGANQTVLVRAELPNREGRLRPGQFVEVRIAHPGAGDGWRVPREAVLRVRDRTWVLVAAEGGFRPVPVKVLAEAPGALVVEGALRMDDRVVVQGTAALKAAWLEGEG